MTKSRTKMSGGGAQMRGLKQIQKTGCTDYSRVLDHLWRNTLESIIWIGWSGIDHLGCIVNKWRKCSEHVADTFHDHIERGKKVHLWSFVILWIGIRHMGSGECAYKVIDDWRIVSSNGSGISHIRKDDRDFRKGKEWYLTCRIFMVLFSKKSTSKYLIL